MKSLMDQRLGESSDKRATSYPSIREGLNATNEQRRLLRREKRSAMQHGA